MTRKLLLLITISLLGAVPVLGQTATDGSIRGSVKDVHGAVLTGVRIIATSSDHPAGRAAVTDADGFYRLSELPPAEYVVTAERPGFARFHQEQVLVRAGINLLIDITMVLGGASETVEVRAETPMLDVTSVVRNVNISGDFQRRVPISIRREWADFLSMTPGVVSTQAARVNTYYLHGSDYSAHAFQIDGADMASAQQNYNSYLQLSGEAIADVRVKSGAIDAASPLGTGAVISVVTRGGTNALKGALTLTSGPRRWNDSNTPGGTSAVNEVWQLDASAGGPVLRGRWWFFGAYRAARNTAGISRSAEQLAILKALRGSFEPFDSDNFANYYFMKMSGRIGSRHELQGYYQYDASPNGAYSAIDADRFRRTVNGGNGFSFRLSSIWGSSWTTRLAASYNDKAFQTLSLQPGLSARTVHERAFPSSGRLLGTGAIAQLDNSNNGESYDQPYDKQTISGDLTWFRTGWAGSHELQAGVYLQPRLHQESRLRYANDGFAWEELVLRDPANAAAGTLAFHRRVYDAAEVVAALGDSRDVAVYAQDAWRPSPRVTLNLGFRADLINRRDSLFDVIVQKRTELGPRFGVNYAVTGDHHNVVRLSWGRLHEVLSQNWASAGTNTAGFRDLYDKDLNGVFETTFITPPSTKVASDRLIDPGRRQPYVDEWIISYQRQFDGRLIADVSFIRRSYRARSALVESNGLYENGVFRGYRNEALNEIYLLTSNRWNWHVYSGLEFQVAKQARQLQLLGAYTYGFQHIAGTWQPNDPAVFIQAEAFSNNVGIGSVRASTGSPSDANSLSARHMVDNAAWRPQTIKLAASWLGPRHLTIATSYVMQSGPYSGPIVARLGAPDPRFGPATVTLSNGRVVSNPLATTIRFAYPTRAEGQLQLPPIHIWNLRLGTYWQVGRSRLECALDVFNVTNLGADQAFMSGANQRYSSNYGKSTARQLPRAAQVVVRAAF